jgi:probable phosphoglycerate mutase
MITRRAFWFLRHGETDWNRRGHWQGQSDVPLNANGEAQAQAAIAQLLPLGIKTICASRLQRARRTADIVAGALGLPVTEVAGLEEMNIGPYAGSATNHWLGDWRDDKEVEGVESFPDFRRRVAGAINTVVATSEDALIVAHGGVFWALERLCGAGTFSALAHCAPARLIPEGATRWRIEVAGSEDEPDAGFIKSTLYKA